MLASATEKVWVSYLSEFSISRPLAPAESSSPDRPIGIQDQRYMELYVSYKVRSAFCVGVCEAWSKSIATVPSLADATAPDRARPVKQCNEKCGRPLTRS